MRSPFVLPCVAAAVLTAPAATQRQLPEPQQVRKERSYQGSYSEPVSRELFTACDTDSDDRLDVFEASVSFERLRDPRDSEGYARLDRDRDGYVTWPEFDAVFRSGLRDGGTFRVTTTRPFVMPVLPPGPPTPVRRFLMTHDGDGDGSLSPEEIERLLVRTGLPEGLAEPLKGLDVDRSGKIDETELAPWFELLPPAARNGPAGESPLPPPWFEADRDRDGKVDRAELEAVLRRIDPMLAFWAPKLLQRRDRDADQKLSGAELTPPEAAPGAATPPPANAPPRTLPTR